MPSRGWDDLPRRERRRLVREAGSEPAARAIFESGRLAGAAAELADRVGGGPFQARPRPAGAWDTLSPAYRLRLERAGITRTDFQRGVPLGRARGHLAAEEARTRRERGISRGLSPTQAAGRPRPGEVPASAIVRQFFGVPIRLPGGATGLADITPRNAGAASRIGEYLADVGQLISGRLPAGEFRSRWRSRRVAGHRFEWDPARVLEILRRSGPEPGAERYRRVLPGAAA